MRLRGDGGRGEKGGIYTFKRASPSLFHFFAFHGDFEREAFYFYTEYGRGLASMGGV